MSHKCQISGKSRQHGHRVSHAKNRTKHVFKANLQEKKIFVPELQAFVKVKVSTRILRSIDRFGLLNVLKKHDLTIQDVVS